MIRWSALVRGEGPGGGVGDGVVGEHPKGGEADRPPYVGGRGEYGHDGADHEFGPVWHLELRVDGGQGVREVVVAGHGQGRARDPEDQREEGAERGHRSGRSRVPRPTESGELS